MKIVNSSLEFLNNQSKDIAFLNKIKYFYKNKFKCYLT